MGNKLRLTLFFPILLLLVIGAVSAVDSNSTDIMDENSVMADNNCFEVDNDDVLKYDGNENSNISLNSQSTDLKENTDTSKADLKITANTNLIKNGQKATIQLTDMKGNSVENKKLNISYDGKNYVKTTNSKGKVSIAVNSQTPTTSLKISFEGDNDYNGFVKKLTYYIDNSFGIEIGNSKLLTNGYLRIYLKGSKKLISYKTIKIKIGSKVYTKKTNAEGFVIIKPKLSPKKYTVKVTYGKYKVSKQIKCIKGNVINPLKKAVPTKNGVPDIDLMEKKFIMGDNDAKYCLEKSQYREVLKRDSYCLFLYGKLSKYTFFKTKESPKIYHILKREKWNVIERALNTKLVKKNKYSYWPKSITANLKGKSYTYPEVRDIQNEEYTCGPTSASVCSQVLKKYNSEKFFQIKAHVTNGVNIDVLKKALDTNNFKTSYYYGSGINNAVKQLTKGSSLIAYLKNHYVAIIDISKDGKKILVSNSYGDYNVGGANKVPTDWVSLKYFKTKFQGVGLVVKLKYNLKNSVKKEVKNYYKSMGTNWIRQNTNERIPDIGK